MKMAAANALAKLAREPVPKEVLQAYNKESMSFGKEYIIPTPFDPRLITVVSTAVAKAAIESGVAKRKIEDWTAYELELRERVGNFAESSSLSSQNTVHLDSTVVAKAKN
jgi:malate dehydrogenase (oxaloacetate-decarboxylating)(NADP+)